MRRRKTRQRKTSGSEEYRSIYTMYLSYDYDGYDCSENDSIELIILEIKTWIEHQRDNRRVNYKNYFHLLAKLWSLLKNTEQLTLAESNVLINFLLKDMSIIESNIFQQSCENDLLLSLINQDTQKSVVGKFMLFSIPKLHTDGQDYLFRFLLESLRNSSKQTLPSWVYHEGIILLAEGSNTKKKTLVRDFYLKKLLEGTFNQYCYDGLKYILLKFCPPEYRLKFFKTLCGYLQAHGHCRVKQKKIQHLFIFIYDHLETEEERTSIFQKIIIPMIDSTNIYVRQSLAEILEQMKVLPEAGWELLYELSKDSESEVKRFADSVLANLARTARTTNSPLTPRKSKKGNSTHQKLKRKPRPRVSRKKYQIAEKFEHDLNAIFSEYTNQLDKESLNLRTSQKQFQKPQQELNEFKRTINPTNLKQICISCINHENRYIREYSWDKLQTRYLSGNATNKDKKSWINIIFAAFKRKNFVLTEHEFIDHIFHKLKPIKILAPILISKILGLLKNTTDIDYREWINLLRSLLSVDIDKTYVKRITDDYKAMINGKRHTFSVKRVILNNITSIQWFYPDSLTMVMSVLVDITYHPDNRLRSMAYNIISNQLSSIAEIENLTSDFFTTLGHINIRYNRIYHEGYDNLYAMLEQLLGYLVHIIARSGNTPQGSYAINTLAKIIKDSSTSFTAICTCILLDNYGIDSLNSLIDLQKLIAKKIQEYPKCSVNEEYKYIDTLIRQNRLNAANDRILELEEHYIFLPLSIFFKAEIKFKQKHFSEAIELYNSFLMDNPYYIQAKKRIYQCYQKMGAFHAANKIEQEIHFMSPRLELSTHQDNITPLEPGNIKILEESIAIAEFELEKFNRDALRLIHNDTINNEETKNRIEVKFKTLKENLKQCFGETVITEVFDRPPKLDWEKLKLIDYPHQLPRYMQDIFMGILHVVLPKHSIQYYRTYHNSVERMRSLDAHITKSHICDFVEEKNPVKFLKTKFEVMSAYDFIRKNAFSDNFVNACALGLGGDISSAYNILIGMLRLKHYHLVYEEVDVEPSGCTQHTREFIKEILKRPEPVVMFVPIIVEKPGTHNITLDEIKCLITAAKSESLADKVYLVFGAYDFLPIYIQSLDPVNNQRSPTASFKITLDHIIQFYDIRLTDKSQHYQHLMQHMLETRIKTNVISATPEDKTLQNLLKKSVSDLFTRKIDFVSLLQIWVEQFPKTAQVNGGDFVLYQASDWKNLDQLLAILNAILFTNMPWFNSCYQLPDTSFAEILKQKLIGLKKLFETDFKRQVFKTETIDKNIQEISNFLSYLDKLISDIEYGLQWQGISTYRPKKESDNKTKSKGKEKAVNDSDSDDDIGKGKEKINKNNNEARRTAKTTKKPSLSLGQHPDNTWSTPPQHTATQDQKTIALTQQLNIMENRLQDYQKLKEQGKLDERGHRECAQLAAQCLKLQQQLPQHQPPSTTTSNSGASTSSTTPDQHYHDYQYHPY